jgi:hypothetical protein
MNPQNRFRKVRLDFHNSPLQAEIGAQFDADEFADTLAAAHVNSVGCYAKCRYGMSYYPTRIGTRHPALTFDLLGAQIEACRKREIAVSVAFSVAWDAEAARRHPEWRQLGPDGAPRRSATGAPGVFVCLNSPYIEELLLPQTEEVLRAYDADGLWFGGLRSADQACWCERCRRDMRDSGLDGDDPAQRRRYGENTICGFLEKISAHVRRIRPAVDLEYDSLERVGARRVVAQVTDFEIECPPAARGYLAFTLFARHLRTLGRPTRGVTSGCFRDDGDFGSSKNHDQLRWETATMLANGSQCAVSDPLHPRGRLEPAVYGRLGQVFAAVARREEWCCGAVPMTEIAVLADDSRETCGTADAPDAVWGAVRLLVETHCQFDIVDREADFAKYELLILPDNREIDAPLAARIQTHIERGGRLMASGLAGYSAAAGDFAIPGLGVKYAGFSPSSTNYLRLVPAAAPRPGSVFAPGKRHPPGTAFAAPQDSPDMPLAVRYPFVQVEPGPETEVIAAAWRPYGARAPEQGGAPCPAPWDRPAPYPAIVRRSSVIYFAAPIFDAYQRDGDTHNRLLFQRCLDLLLPRRLLHTDGPPTLEGSLMRQPGRVIAHLVNYVAGRRGRGPETIDQAPPLHNVALRVRTAKPVKAYLAPSREPVAFDYAHGYVMLTVPVVDVHQMAILASRY